MSIFNSNALNLYIQPYKLVPNEYYIYNDIEPDSDLRKSISKKHMTEQEYKEVCDDLKKYYEDLGEDYSNLRQNLHIKNSYVNTL
jgi:hypothetical protein